MSLISLIKNQKGVAIPLAVFAMVISIMVATEVAYETHVEYVSSSHGVNKVKAYYAAKSGVELSLYRILLYKKVLAQFGDQLKDNKSLADPIWQFPFTWPPIGLEELNAVDKDAIMSIVKESSLDTQYTVTIDGEGGRIDINDLASENKALADGVRAQLLQIFSNEIENNKKFKDKYESFKFAELINNIQDWVDEDTKSLNRGDESSFYEQLDDTRNLQLPPNTPFKTLKELHMVKDMEDEFFDLLKDKITVFGTKGINLNYAPEKVLSALDPQIKDKVLEEIIKRRSNPDQGGPFKNEDDFYGFVEGQGVRTENMKKAGLPLLFDAEYNFRIISAGQSGNIRRELTVITYDIENLTTRYSEMLDKIDEENKQPEDDPNPTAPPTGDDKKDPAEDKKENVKAPKGRPSVVFWQET